MKHLRVSCWLLALVSTWTLTLPLTATIKQMFVACCHQTNVLGAQASFIHMCWEALAIWLWLPALFAWHSAAAMHMGHRTEHKSIHGVCLESIQACGLHAAAAPSALHTN